MEINEIKVKPAQDSINPEMVFEIELNIKTNSEIPLVVYGSIISDENKKIVNIYELIYESNHNMELAAYNRENEGESKLIITVFAPLNHKVLDYIETRRTINPKGDVILKLDISIKTLYSKAQISSMFVAENISFPDLPTEYERAKPVFYDYHSGRHLSRSDMWILSGDSNATFIGLINNNFKKVITIKSNDWNYDFCPVFQIGKFFVFEYLMPDYIEGTEPINERLAGSIDAIKKMEEHIIKGEWNEVIEDSRAVGELLRNQDEIKDLLIRDGYTDQAFTDLNESLKNLFNFSSKFHHREDRGKKIMPEIKASKEDAYLIYTVSMNVVNLISKKIQRLDKQ